VTDYEIGLAAIKNVLESVANIGVVHDYDRWTANLQEFRALYLVTIDGVQQVRGWDICEDTDEWRPTAARGVHEHRVRYLIRGYQSVNDELATGKTFRALAETVCQTLRSNTSLNGACREVLPPAIAVYQPLKFFGILCHYVEIPVEVLFDRTLTLA